MAKKKKNKSFEEITIDEVVMEEVIIEEVSEVVVEPKEEKKECKKDGLATIMVTVNSIRYEGIIVRRGDHLKMCKEEAKKAAAAKRCIIL